MATWKTISTYTLCKNVCIFRQLVLEVVNIGDRLWALEKQHQFTCAFGKSNLHWFLRHDLNWGTWFLPVSHVGFYLIFSFLSQRYGKHLSQWCISARRICGSFFNFLEDLLASYFLFCLWQENKTKKTPCTAKARSGKARMSSDCCTSNKHCKTSRFIKQRPQYMSH